MRGIWIMAGALAFIAGSVQAQSPLDRLTALSGANTPPAAPAAQATPWQARLAPGAEYHGKITADDPPVPSGAGGTMAAKCAAVPTEAGVAYELVLRKAPDNPHRNIFLTGPAIQVGTGSCADLKVALNYWIDPASPPPRARWVAGGGDYVVRILSHKSDPAQIEADSFHLAFNKIEVSPRYKRLAAAGPASEAGPSGRAGADASVEAALRQYCTPGAEKMTAATCQAMRRDAARAAAEAAAAAARAEAQRAHARLCAPGTAKLSPETCAAMRAEAEGQAPVQAAGPVPAPTLGAATELVSAYDELCGATPTVSAETCAALKADAASRTAKPAPAPKGMSR